ncbi:MAG: ABC transporter ATP-binding protein [Candidatus Hydrogenedentes bacterium]|nr:ABC transporter ATP-binding protein [Candidatus Hydrogenedentota bacterium]
MIHTESLTKRFGDNTAVDCLDLDIAQGEFFCFLGPNGAGKTTTIKMLTGLMKPTSGAASIGGFDILTEAVKAKGLLGYIPDHPFLYEKLTGREFMHFVAGLYKMSGDHLEDRVDELLDTFEVGDVGDQLIENYSHGMRQKLSFASCFLHRPKVVIVDEPWVGLDPKNIRAVKTYLKRKTLEEGLTVLMSTHTLSIAEEIADRIGIIHLGKLLHVGTVGEIMKLEESRETLEEVFLELTKGEEVA